MKHLFLIIYRLNLRKPSQLRNVLPHFHIYHVEKLDSHNPQSGVRVKVPDDAENIVTQQKEKKKEKFALQHEMFVVG